MSRNWRTVVLPAAALVLAGGALLTQNLPSVTADVPAATAGQVVEVVPADDNTAPTAAKWVETGIIRPRPGGTPTNPPVHTTRP